MINQTKIFLEIDFGLKVKYTNQMYNFTKKIKLSFGLIISKIPYLILLTAKLCCTWTGTGTCTSTDMGTGYDNFENCGVRVQHNIFIKY